MSFSRKGRERASVEESVRERVREDKGTFGGGWQRQTDQEDKMTALLSLSTKPPGGAFDVKGAALFISMNVSPASDVV